MALNSNYKYFPPQPGNPTDDERDLLALSALAELGRAEDFEYVKKLMAPPQDITAIAGPGAFKNCSIGIVGGGLAGMAAAFELRKLGIDITIFEAQDRIGGRVYTYYFDHEKTLYGELGPMRVPVIHETTWHYINLFKLNTRTFIQSNNNGIIYLRGAHSRSDPDSVKRNIYPRFKLTSSEKNTSWKDLEVYGYNSTLFSAPPHERTEILQVKKNYNPYTLYWDRNSNRQILEGMRLSEDAINLISYLLPISGNFIYNSYIDFIDYYPANFSYLYEIMGGLTKLPLAFYDSFLSENPYKNIKSEDLGIIKWKGRNWVCGIYKNTSSGRVGISYRNSLTNGELYGEFDYVVCAIPFSTLRDIKLAPLFTPEKMQAIKEVTYGNAQRSIILCRNRFWEEGDVNKRIIGGPSYTDLPVTSIWYPSDHAQFAEVSTNINDLYSKKPGVLIEYNFNQDAVRLGGMPYDMRFETIKRQIEGVHSLPWGYLDDIAIEMKTVNWNDEKWFRGAFCCFSPDQKRLFSYPMTVPEYNGRIFFAGEHISPLHRWMQGALKSGMEAANDIAMACRKGLLKNTNSINY